MDRQDQHPSALESIAFGLIIGLSGSFIMLFAFSQYASRL